ncbi:hypothetical protein [Archangium sp. Cb G35]|uniref:hypothetical protein n=1 Tax=Archangium sp. Cb G35 TaxID=1920190 RepID=UPI000AF2BC6B|nr:hypothetical protein [Archangium sp. Cb G35]
MEPRWLERGDVLIASVTLGFTETLHRSTLRLAASGKAEYESHAWLPGGEQRRVRIQHRFNDSAMRRILGLVQGLPEQASPRAIVDDWPQRVLHFWSGQEERTVSLYGVPSVDSYPAFHRVMALWAILHFPFEKESKRDSP